MWKIVPQIVMRRGEEYEVPVKLISKYPEIDNQTGEVVGFGNIAARFRPWQVIIQRSNWRNTDVWRVQWHPASGNYRIILREWQDKVSPRDKRWKGPGHTVRQIEEYRGLKLKGFMNKLAELIKDPEFEGLILGTLHSGAKQ